VQAERVPRAELAAVALAVERQGRPGLRLHAHLDRPLAVGADLPQVAGPVAAAGVDAVEALGAPAGVGVARQPARAPVGQRVGGRADRNRRQDGLARLQLRGRHLEGVVPERLLARADLLALEQVEDALALLNALPRLGIQKLVVDLLAADDV